MKDRKSLLAWITVTSREGEAIFDVYPQFLLTHFYLKLESNIDFLSLYHQKLDCGKQLPHVHQTYFRSSNERWLCRLDPRCQHLQIGEKKHWFSY